MNSLIDKEKFIELLKEMIEGQDYIDCVFFVYSDGIRWGVEIYKGEKAELDESKTASMWWNIAMKHAYKLQPEPSSDLTFSFTFFNSRKDKELTAIDEVEGMDKLFKAELEKTSLYASLQSG